MTGIARRTQDIIPFQTTACLKTLLACLTVVSLTACETVDLGPPASETVKTLEPNCLVNANDYRVLAYLQESADAEKTTRITNVLKKKYSTDASGNNPIEAAQAYVAASADKSPAEISAMVEAACQN